MTPSVFGSKWLVMMRELFAPISGTVLERNDPLIDSPDSLNEDPYEEGWMIKVKPADASEVGKLLDQAAYVDFLEEQAE